MAIKDVRSYYAKCIVNKLELENDLTDFEQAFKDGYIDEEKLIDVKNEYARMQENIDRLAYILYLIERPNRKSKQARFNKSTEDIEDGFEKLNASEKCILDENKSTLKYIREELKKLTKAK